ncbi:Invasin IpaC [Pandoraea iniqua]|uniref:IpaC/SipC family type III secretion system effector n=1 Tax=Pandoraea iniqua TaxID=2508288 RepID=UPI00124308C2|nr:IpaC/SipC family type III secretion system effector [Pandoraea iniqua]VVD64544.1 Invasin IpaC [Pandoraea iniqua]
MTFAIDSRPVFVAPNPSPLSERAVSPIAGIPRLFDPDADAQRQTKLPALNEPSPLADRLAAQGLLRQIDAAGNLADSPAGNREMPDARGGVIDESPTADGGFGGIMSKQGMLLLQFFAFFQKAFENDIKLRSALTQMNAESLKASVEAIKKGGLANMMGNVSGATISLGMAGAGAFQQLKTVATPTSALRPDVTPDVPPLSPSPSSSPLSPPLSPPSSSTTPRFDTGNTPAVAGAQDLPDVPLAPPAPEVPEMTPSTVAADTTLNPLEAQRTKGQALMQLAGTTGSIATGSGRYAESIAQADQRQKDAASQVHKDATGSTQEQANRDSAMIADMLKAIETAMQSRTSAMGLIAGNIRA